MHQVGRAFLGKTGSPERGTLRLIEFLPARNPSSSDRESRLLLIVAVTVSFDVVESAHHKTMVRNSVRSAQRIRMETRTSTCPKYLDDVPIFRSFGNSISVQDESGKYSH